MTSTSPNSRKQAFANYVVELMAGFAPVQAKSMFGGHGVYCDGVMFALLVEERLYLKVDEQSLGRFTARGLGPFTYEAKGKRMSVHYYEAPPEAYDEPEHMAVWARLGYECALRKQKAKAPKSPKSGKALQNLGPKSQEMLAKAGIKTEAQLRKLGAVRAYAKTKAVCPKASLNLLWALEGALTGRDWKAVAESERASLLMALEDAMRHMAG
jgi:DNA transformation protein